LQSKKGKGDDVSLKLGGKTGKNLKLFRGMGIGEGGLLVERYLSQTKGQSDEKAKIILLPGKINRGTPLGGGGRNTNARYKAKKSGVGGKEIGSPFSCRITKDFLDQGKPFLSQEKKKRMRRLFRWGNRFQGKTISSAERLVRVTGRSTTYPALGGRKGRYAGFLRDRSRMTEKGREITLPKQTGGEKRSVLEGDSKIG